jgi:hypothetical protein
VEEKLVEEKLVEERPIRAALKVSDRRRFSAGLDPGPEKGHSPTGLK